MEYQDGGPERVGKNGVKISCVGPEIFYNGLG